MQTSANTQDSHDWIVAVGYGALVVFVVAWLVLAYFWWRSEMAKRAKLAGEVDSRAHHPTNRKTDA